MQEPTVDYASLVLRNAGYIDAELQARIRRTRLLVAGCGIGSTVAETALRTGFERIALVDGDAVAPHNLNRQAFTAADVGASKARRLGERLTRIHPGAAIEAHERWVTPGNAAALVRDADVVIDTVDFLDLAAIVALHDAAGAAGKPIVSAFSAGWGAVGLFFPPGAGCTLRDLFGLPRDADLAGASYVARFEAVLAPLAASLPAETVAAMQGAIRRMADGVPCPAPQLAVGAALVAGLCVTIVTRHLAGEPVAAAPKMIILDAVRACATAAAEAPMP